MYHLYCIALGPKTMKNEGFTPPKYMKVVGSHGKDIPVNKRPTATWPEKSIDLHGCRQFMWRFFASQPEVSNEKKLGCLGSIYWGYPRPTNSGKWRFINMNRLLGDTPKVYIRDYATQLCKDLNKPLKGSL